MIPKTRREAMVTSEATVLTLSAHRKSWQRA
jgi:hypothetical protein